MACYELEFPTSDGSEARGFVCSRGATRPRRCVGCRRLIADRLCDVPVPGRTRNGDQKTCSAPVCRSCSVQIDDADVCTAHPVPDELIRQPAGVRR